MLQAGPAKKKSLDTEGGDGGPQVRLGSFVDPAAIQTFPLLHRSTLNTHLESHYPRCYVIYSGLLSEPDNCQDAPHISVSSLAQWRDTQLSQLSRTGPRIQNKSWQRRLQLSWTDSILGTLLCYDSNTQRQTVFLYCVNELLQSKTKSIPSSFLLPSLHILTVW